MSFEEAISALQSFGLTRIQAQIFVYLSCNGPSSISALARALKTNRMNIHRNVRRMLDKGLVTIVPGRPMKFLAVSADAATDTLILMAKKEFRNLKRNGQKF